MRRDNPSTHELGLHERVVNLRPPESEVGPKTEGKSFVHAALEARPDAPQKDGLGPRGDVRPRKEAGVGVKVAPKTKLKRAVPGG
jgi:hypothetical protein